MRTRKQYCLFRVLNLSNHFEGHPNAAVSCLSLLSGQGALGLIEHASVMDVHAEGVLEDFCLPE
jgi:hypothetical protein